MFDTIKNLFEQIMTGKIQKVEGEGETDLKEKVTYKIYRMTPNTIRIDFKIEDSQ